MPVTYIALSCFAAACSLVVAARVWANGDFTGRNALMALLIASAVWALFAGLYEFTPVVETKHWIINIYFPSIVTVPVAMLVFALQYSGNGRWVTRPMLATLVLIPILTVVAVWSNPHHWLFWSEIVWDYSEPFPIGRFSHGPAFWVWVAFAYTVLLIGSSILLVSIHRTQGIFRKQNLAMLVAVASPWICNVLYMTGMTPWPHLDFTSLGFTLTALAMTWGVFRLRISDLVPVARASVLNSLSDAVFVLDTNDCIVDLNRAAGRILRSLPDEVLGEPVQKVLGPFPALLRELEVDTEKRVALSRAEVELCVSGEPAFFDVRISRIESESDLRAGTSIVLTDITEIKGAEQERLRLQDELQHSQKLESLGVLAGGIAHDFNNLLLGISGNAELALLDTDPDSPTRDNLEKISVISERGAELCHQLLAYSGKGKFVVEPISINKVLREMEHILSVSIPKTVTVEYDLDEALPPIIADVAQMQQLIMNLMINAAEAINGETGTVTVSTRKVSCDSKYLDKLDVGGDLPNGDYVCIEVRDTGSGMDAKTRKKIFDPFFTTKFTGRGLGMSAVLGIIRGHQGGLGVESEPGVGTLFRIVLPEAEAALIEPEDRCSLDDWSGEGTVLIVDDEEMVRDITRRMLERLEFTVLTAVDGVEAMEIYRQHRDDIVCIVLDLAMPNMRGQECYRELRELNQEVSIVVMSGYSEAEIDPAFFSTNRSAFVQKPFQARQLREALQSAELPLSSQA